MHHRDYLSLAIKCGCYALLSIDLMQAVSLNEAIEDFFFFTAMLNCSVI